MSDTITRYDIPEPDADDVNAHLEFCQCDDCQPDRRHDQGEAA